MPNPIVQLGSSLGGVAVATAMSEGTRSPKAIALFYIEVAKSCHDVTGKKRLACAVAAGACGLTLIPGSHQFPFIVACAASLRGANKL